MNFCHTFSRKMNQHFFVEDTCLFFLEILMFGNQMPHSPQREVLFWVWGPWGKFLKCALIFTLDCIGFRELFCKERRQWSIAQGNSAKISPRRRKLSCQNEIIDCGHLPGNSQLWTFINHVCLLLMSWSTDKTCVIYVIFKPIKTQLLSWIM